MSTAAATREAVRDHPFLLQALRAGVVNYTAAAAFLDVGETEPVATALRRFADDLPEFETRDADARVRMESGVGVIEDAESASEAGDDTEVLLSIGGAAVVPDAGSMTAVLATGDVDVAALAAVCGRLDAEDIDAEAAAVAEGTLLVVVDRRAGVSALRAVEDALANVPV
ncbi:DUF7523 family protein [Halolamina salifodinae]|uniref:Uncharacterized protein n=1 Tax=Halolamina salifodinae TaxID=1202767 RepID=A0A8T4GWF8_9EURY|nr:hypothetical protein [Halolamina salifodinae]MBP1985638.1 hypothetical protein [Halolamina salifodinae]